ILQCSSLLSCILWSQDDPRAVLVGLLLVLSAFQYLNQWTRYTQAIDMIDKRTEEYFGKELELQIKGAEKPSMWGLVVVQLLVLPYTLSKVRIPFYIKQETKDFRYP
ncbi:Dnaj protein erdj7, partial [Thalictrum thalictroides]